MKNEVSLNGKAEIDIDALDTKKETLEYQCSFGQIERKKENLNIFLFNLSNINLKENTELQRIKIVTINEDNVVSPIYEFQIN